MVLGGHSQHLHGDVLERQQKLGAVGKQQVDVGPGKPHHHVRSLKGIVPIPPRPGSRK